MNKYLQNTCKYYNSNYDRSMKKYLQPIIILVLLVLLVIILSDSDHQTSPSNKEKTGDITVVTSFYPLAYALEQIIGNTGTVINIGEGQDPHDFHPSTKDVLSMEQADVVVLQGAGFETWGHDMEEQLEESGVPVIIATETLELQTRVGSDDHQDASYNETEANDHEHDEDSVAHEEHAEDGHNHGMYDPHTWVDPSLFTKTVEYLVHELAILNPTNATIYQENAMQLLDELQKLDREYKTGLAQCSYDEVIVSHNSFGYLASHYGFTTHAIAGLSTQDQPSVLTLASLKQEAEEGVGAILLEQNSVTAYGEMLETETGLVTYPINPIAFQVAKDEDYLSISRSNLATLTQALHCNE